MHNVLRAKRALLLASVACVCWGSASILPYPALSLVERELLTTAKDDFTGQQEDFDAAVRWDGARTRTNEYDLGAPYLVCAEYNSGYLASSRLQAFLSPEAVRPVSYSSEHGACFFATASHNQAEVILADQSQFGLVSAGSFPSALKLAPGLLDHNGRPDRESHDPDHLTATHGPSMRANNVNGLNVELSPGTPPGLVGEFINGLLDELMSESINLHATNFWSDPAIAGGKHLATPDGALRGRNWNKAGTVVHKLSEAGRTTPGDICSWESVSFHPAGNDVLLVSGLDHLLYSGRGAGGNQDEAPELHAACFMGLLSILASRVEVLRVSPRHSNRLLNAAARANIQSATVTRTPLTDAGLDGTGEVIQIVDSGLDETSCFFIDDSGEEVPHGHYFEELGIGSASSSSTTYYSSDSSSYSDSSSTSSSSSYTSSSIFEGGDFSFYPERRKIVQYTNLVKSDSVPGSHGSSFSTSQGYEYPWLPADSFEVDDAAGHGTHTAGSAAGATLNVPAKTVACDGDKVVSCVGGCIDDDPTRSDDDLAPQSEGSYSEDVDRLCPLFECDQEDNQRCLDNDVGVTLAEHGGMAQGSKLAIFDVDFYGTVLAESPGNGLWEACLEAGCKLHSNSWGGDPTCSVEPLDVVYDDFMYKNPENLLIFAAGNAGETVDDSTACTIGSPAISKNVLAVGASSSGETRLTSIPEADGFVDIDMVASFSSYGPASDGRIKPEVVAPGDAIYSAAGDGTDAYSCRLWVYAGTSMSCPIVAGAAAMVRQYFLDASFYAADVTSRGFCDDGFLCEGFSPSSATVKALLINSANLMGGSSEPDGFRGFGRIHLEKGMPLDGEGNLVLFVADAAYTSIPELTQQEYFFEVDGDAGLDLRVTLSWIDPAASTFSGVQLVNDLDLSVISPRGVNYTMWSSGNADRVNVNERVIVDALDVESGKWTVQVGAERLSTEFQKYSLVVNGAIHSPADEVTDVAASANGSASSAPVSLALLLFCALASLAAAVCSQ